MAEELDSIGVRRLYEGDLKGLETFLRFVSRTLSNFTIDSMFRDESDGLEIRLRSVARETERAAEYVAGRAEERVAVERARDTP